MAIADILSGIGKGAEEVGKATVPILQRTAEVVSGEAPQIDAESRKRAEELEDQQIAAKAEVLENNLALGQKYGTLTPDQQQQYVDAISGLYNKPRHAQVLMDKLRKAIHPNGMVAQAPQPALANPVPQGGTNEADEQARMRAALMGEDQKEYEARQQAVATADFLASQLPPGTSDADKTAFRNNALDHLLKASTGREPAPKGMKAIVGATGVAAGITDQDTGKQYFPNQLGEGGDAPPQAKTMWNAIQKAEKEKQAAADAKFDKEQREINARQERSNSNMLGRMQLQFQNMLSMGNFRAANNVIQGLEKNYSTSQTLESRMQKLQAQAMDALNQGKHNQQAELAILANHIAMTTHQPGASMRPTKSLFDEAAAAQPWLQKVEKRVDSDGIISGVVLSKQQIQQMVDLAPVMVNSDLDALNQARQLMQDQLNPEPAGTTGAKKVGKILPKTGAKPAASLPANSNDPLGVL